MFSPDHDAKLKLMTGWQL